MTQQQADSCWYNQR